MQETADSQQLSREELEELLNDLPNILRQLTAEFGAHPDRSVSGSRE